MYAAERIVRFRSQNKLKRRSRFHRWYPVTFTEMEGFLAVVLNMGVIEVPDIESYWSTSWMSEISFFSRMFSLEQIFWMLHVSHEDPNTPAKRIDKVKGVLDLLVANFQAVLAPSRNLSIDETMVGFRGRFVAKQYMPKKPTKYGIKAFTLAERASMGTC